MSPRFTKRPYRSRSEIVGAMLKATLEGNSKTKIMYESSLSFKQMNEYLPVLLERGLIEYDAKKRKYYSTDKGKEFLRIQDHLRI